MTPEMIAGFAAVILSLAFTFIPKLNAKFAAWEVEYQQLTMLGLMALVSLGAYGIACAGLAVDFGIAVECTQSGAIHLAQALFVAVAFNQGTNTIVPKPKAVKEAKAQRKSMS